MSTLYQDYFGLHKPPFQITPDIDYFFSGSQRGDLLTALLHVASHEEGIVAVIAEVGTGKTLLARLMISRLPPDVSTVYLSNPCFSRDEIISAISRDLGLTNLPASIEEKLACLHQELLRRHANGERVLLVIDEAHAMPAESLEEVRLLSNLETGHNKLVNIMLFGQPELDTLLADPRLRQVRDRVIHRFDLLPFSRDDGTAYIDHRLRVAGWQGGKLFSASALALLMKASGGRARRINLLADKSMLAAYSENLRQVEKRHVKSACNELKDATTSTSASTSRTGLLWPRFSMISALLALSLAGTAVWGYTWYQIGAPAGTVVPSLKLAVADTALPLPAPAKTASAAEKNISGAATNATANAATNTSAAAASNAPTSTKTQETTATTKAAPVSAPAPMSTPSAAMQAAVEKMAATPPSPARQPDRAQPHKAAEVVAKQDRPKAAPLTVATAPTIPAAKPSMAPAPAPAPSANPEAGTGLKMETVLASIQRIVPFALSASSLGPHGRKAIEEILPLAKQAERVNVRGRTDSTGSPAKNKLLAQSRATSVMYAFVSAGVSRNIVKAKYCTSCYVASNDTEQGRRTNRRVDIEVVMPAKLAANLPRPVYSAPDTDDGPVLLAKLDQQFNSVFKRNNF